MKANKLFAGLAAATLAAVLSVPSLALADAGYGGGSKQAAASPAAHRLYVDEDGDGICDNRGMDCQGCPNGEEGQYGRNADKGACDGTGQRLHAHDGTGNGAQRNRR